MRHHRVTDLGEGLFYLPGLFDADQQASIVTEVEKLATTHPWLHPKTQMGHEHAGMVTSWGERGWWSSHLRGRRYIPEHPRTGHCWPPIPACVREVWELALLAVKSPALPWPDTCLCNLYKPGAGLGAHRDTTERDKTSPIVTLTLGAAAKFRCGTSTITVAPGDVVVMSGESRLALHSVSPPDASQSFGLFAAKTVPGIRISLTLRRTGFAPIEHGKATQRQVNR